jgi:hypothetical protein
MLEAATVDMISTIRPLMAIAAACPSKRIIHVFLDDARDHHANRVKVWLDEPGCRIKLHFIPADCPHLNPIERLWGLVHKKITHNRSHTRFADFTQAVLTFLCTDVPQNGLALCDHVSDNVRNIQPQDFRVVN